MTTIWMLLDRSPVVQYHHFPFPPLPRRGLPFSVVYHQQMVMMHQTIMQYHPHLTLATRARRPISTGSLLGNLSRAHVRNRRRVRGRKVLQWITTKWWMLSGALRSPANLIQLVHVLIVHQRSRDVPDADTIIHAQTRTRGRGQDVPPIGRPFTHAGVRGFDCGDLVVVFFHIVNVHLASQVAESGHQDESAAVRREEDGVSRAQGEGVFGGSADVEDGCFGWHVAVYDAEFFRVGVPRHIVNGAFLVCAKGRKLVVHDITNAYFQTHPSQSSNQSLPPR